MSDVEEYHAKESRWQDPESNKVIFELQKKGIEIPWKYGDHFDESYSIVGVRRGGTSVVFIVKSLLDGRFYAAKTLQHFLTEDYLVCTSRNQMIAAKKFLAESMIWLEIGQHPNIVPLHLLINVSHPITDRQIPFILVEYYKKGTLFDHLTIGRLELVDMLVLGIQLCDALGHVYKSGLSFHGDLKPENVIMAGDRLFKLTDFSTGTRGTPGYMSPEQNLLSLGMASGLLLDHRTDQFSLGIVLLEAFKKEHPFPWMFHISDSSGYNDALKMDLENEERGNPRVRKILHKCLNPNPVARYSDIYSLRDDLADVYLAETGKLYCAPVLKADVSVETFFNCGLSYFTMGRFADSIAMFEKADKDISSILEKAKQLDFFRTTNNNLSKDLLKNLLEISADILHLQGIAYQKIGDNEHSRIAIEKAMRIFKKHGEMGKWADCYFALGNIFLDLDRYDEAEKAYKYVMKVFKETNDNETVGDCLSNLGRVEAGRKKFSKADKYYRDAMHTYKQTGGTELKQAECLMSKARLLESLGRFNEAEVMINESFDLFRAIPGTEKNQLGCLSSLGIISRNQGHYEESLEYYRNALNILDSFPKNDIDFGEIYLNMGATLIQLDQCQEAIIYYKKALEVYNYYQGFNIFQSTCYNCLGIAYRHLNELEMAEEHYLKAIALANDISDSDIDKAQFFMNLGIVYCQMKKLDQAKEFLDKSMDVYNKIEDIDFEKARCLSNYGLYYRLKGDFETSVRYCQKGLSLLQDKTGTETGQAIMLFNIAITYLMAKKYETAHDSFIAVLRLCQEHPEGNDHIKKRTLKMLEYL